MPTRLGLRKRNCEPRPQRSWRAPPLTRAWSRAPPSRCCANGRRRSTSSSRTGATPTTTPSATTTPRSDAFRATSSRSSERSRAYARSTSSARIRSVYRMPIARACSVTMALLAAGLASAAPQGASPLIAAAENGDRVGVSRLLDQGAAVDARAVDGTTALHWAVRADRVDVVRALLESGAEASAADRYGVTPLYLAAENGNAAVLRSEERRVGKECRSSWPPYHEKSKSAYVRYH